LKFGDVILTVATTSVIYILVAAVLFMVLISPLGSILAMNTSGIVSMLIAGLLGGVIFAGQIQEESRMKAVGKIAVLLAFVELFAVLIGFPTNSYYGAWTTESLQSMYSTSAWTNADWFAYEGLVTFLNVALNVVLVLVLGFIGLYAGSMLRKPKKT